MLRPYKETIDRWLWPDAFSKQVPSVLKAKQAISNYKKAVGDPAGLAELMVFYCEQASGFASDLGYQDESYLNALVRMFEQALIDREHIANRHSRRTDRSTGSSSQHQPQVRLRRRRRHGFHPCQAHPAQGPSVQAPIILLPVGFTLHAALPKTHDTTRQA